jgi:hypothetical protein
MGLFLMNTFCLSSSVRTAHIARNCKILAFTIYASPLSVRALQSRSYCLTYLTLQRQLSHLNGRKLDQRQVSPSYFQLTKLSVSLILRPAVRRPVRLGIKHPSGAYDQIFITVRQLRVCWYGALSLTRGRVSRLRMLLALVSAVTFRSESRRTRDHILLSQTGDFAFRRLLWLTRLRWRYSTPL